MYLPSQTPKFEMLVVDHNDVLSSKSYTMIYVIHTQQFELIFNLV